jgi:signal transduction histidine kinase
VRRLPEFQALVVGLCAAITLIVSVLSTVKFGYRDDEVHVALETVAVLVSALAAFLLYERFGRTRELRELLLTMALTLLTCANLIGALSSAASTTIDRDAVWAPLFSSLLAAASVATAAWAPRRRVRGSLVGPIAILAAVLAAGAIVGIALLAAPHLSTGIDPKLSPAASDHPRVVGSIGLLSCQLVAMALYGAAAVGFTRRARSGGDELLAWLALASTLAAFSRLNYFLFPSGYSEWVFTGDILRVGVYALILVGAVRTIASYERASAEAAVLEERRRIAQDLHDGLAQDLAFIAMQAAELPRDDQRAARIAEATDYAIAGSRGAILALGVPPDEPLGDSIAALARTLTRRSGAEIELVLEDGLQATAERRDALLRVLSEAISNALRHGRASKIAVRLSGGPGLRLSVLDDGAGFAEREGGGLGLAGMRERVEGLGGEFHLRSRPGHGTEVKVLLP